MWGTKAISSLAARRRERPLQRVAPTRQRTVAVPTSTRLEARRDEPSLGAEAMIGDLRAQPDWTAHVERPAGYASGLFNALR